MGCVIPNPTTTKTALYWFPRGPLFFSQLAMVLSGTCFVQVTRFKIGRNSCWALIRLREEVEAMDLLLFGVWPMLITVLVCSVVGWLLPRVHALVGAGLGLLMGVVNMWSGAAGARIAVSLDFFEQDPGAGLVGSTLAVLLATCIPVGGMWFCSWLRSSRGTLGQ